MEEIFDKQFKINLETRSIMFLEKFRNFSVGV